VTALTSAARPEQDTSLRPVPWRRMAWVTWRQHRTALAGVAVLLGALAVYLWIAGLRLHHAYGAAVGCHPAGSAVCSDLISKFNDMGGLLPNGYILQVLPALIGAFAGAPLLARELETGTFRYAWTQGFGRCRWTLAKLVAFAVVLAAAAGALSALFSWYYAPYFASGHPALSGASPLSPELFDLRGVAFAAWTLAAVAIGALAGMLIRRVVPAIVATLAVYTGLALATGVYLRQHYLAPLAISITRARTLPAGGWFPTQWATRDGRFAFGGLPPASLVRQLCPSSSAAPGHSPFGALVGCLARHGYTVWTSYQPASRFWPFQWIEGGWLLGLSVLLIAATLWLVRRRAT
jgi:hypothetical protein